MKEKELIWSVQNSIGSIVINRPDLHNAITDRMWMEIPVILNKLKSDGAKVVVISGAGSSFCAGADINELKKIDSYEAAKNLWEKISSCLEFLASFDLPTISMINGPCFGGGCLLALACDLRYASDQATFGIPATKLGIVMDESNIDRLIQTVGSAFAMELIFTGNTISCERACQIGLVNSSVDSIMLASYVDEIVISISNNSMPSLIEAKKLTRRYPLKINIGDKEAKEKIIASYLSDEFRHRIAAHNT